MHSGKIYKLRNFVMEKLAKIMSASETFTSGYLYIELLSGRAKLLNSLARHCTPRAWGVGGSVSCIAAKFSLSRSTRPHTADGIAMSVAGIGRRLRKILYGISSEERARGGCYGQPQRESPQRFSRLTHTREGLHAYRYRQSRVCTWPAFAC